jgi:hypothetical protein
LDRDLRHSPQALELACCQPLTALSAVQNHFLRTCQHYPSVAMSSIPFAGFVADDTSAHSTKLEKIVAPYRSQAGSGRKGRQRVIETRCLLQEMFGVLGYRPTEHYAWTSIKSATRPILKSSFLATAYEVYQRFRFRHNLTPSHSVHSLAAIRILSGPHPERNPPIVENGLSAVEISPQNPQTIRIFPGSLAFPGLDFPSSLDLAFPRHFRSLAPALRSRRPPAAV